MLTRARTQVITLRVTGENPEDMDRDLLKSTTASIEVRYSLPHLLPFNGSVEDVCVAQCVHLGGWGARTLRTLREALLAQRLVVPTVLRPT